MRFKIYSIELKETIVLHGIFLISTNESNIVCLDIIDDSNYLFRQTLFSANEIEIECKLRDSNKYFVNEINILPFESKVWFASQENKPYFQINTQDLYRQSFADKSNDLKQHEIASVLTPSHENSFSLSENGFCKFELSQQLQELCQQLLHSNTRELRSKIKETLKDQLLAVFQQQYNYKHAIIAPVDLILRDSSLIGSKFTPISFAHIDFYDQTISDLISIFDWKHDVDEKLYSAAKIISAWIPLSSPEDCPLLLMDKQTLNSKTDTIPYTAVRQNGQTFSATAICWNPLQNWYELPLDACKHGIVFETMQTPHVAYCKIPFPKRISIECRCICFVAK